MTQEAQVTRDAARKRMDFVAVGSCRVEADGLLQSADRVGVAGNSKYRPIDADSR